MLTEDIKDKYYLDIIICLLNNIQDTNKFIIDKIINEEKDEKKLLLIDIVNKYIDNDMIWSWYINQLFSIFKNNDNLCLKESQSSECLLCCKKIYSIY